VKPILFSTEMVRAMLDGRKTMTRRVVKPILSPGFTFVERGTANKRFGWSFWGDGDINHEVKPPCRTGDILWVRETWYKNYPHKYGKYFYRADGEETDIPLVTGGTTAYGKADGLKWRPSIHMPREAARIFLRVRTVRVERVQEITEVDAEAEGIEPKGIIHVVSARYRFAQLWNDLNAKRGYGWDTNPFVWVIEFEQISREEAVCE
jgi:hypothetical protein